MHMISTLLLAGVASTVIASTSLAANTTQLEALNITVATAAEANINAPYNAFLEKYGSTADGVNLLDYGAVTDADHQSLKDYIATLEQLTPSTMSQNEELAFWFNLYNAKTIDLIVEAYPVKSIRSLGLLGSGPWGKKVLTVEGNELSLDNIEHDTVREKYDEPRVHYAFNCASIGCPNLAFTAWEADTLDDRLDDAARAYIAHPRGISVDNRGRVTASSIYKWFKEDFGSNDSEVLDHIRQYATDAKLEVLEGKTKINKYDYNWDLNDAK